MNFPKRKVAVLFGGRGVEHSVSCRSGASVLLGLDGNRFSTLPIGIAPDGVFYLFSGEIADICDGSWVTKTDALTPTFPVRLGNQSGFFIDGSPEPVDVALPVLHGDAGEDGTVQGALVCAGIPYVGCTPAVGALCTDKKLSKMLAASLGVPVLPDVVLSPTMTPDAALQAVRSVIPSPHPVFLKPVGLGSSVGCCPVTDDSRFPDAFREAVRFGNVLAEPFLSPVRELEIAFLHADGKDLFSSPGEIRTHEFYSYEEKYGKSRALLSDEADLPDALTKTLRRYAARIVRGFGVRDLCRVDFFLAENGVFFNEINPFPGMTSISLYPRLTAKTGYPFREMIAALVNNALHRSV